MNTIEFELAAVVTKSSYTKYQTLAYANAHAHFEWPNKRPVLIQRHPNKCINSLHYGHHLHVVEEYAEKRVERPMLNQIGSNVCGWYA